MTSFTARLKSAFPLLSVLFLTLWLGADTSVHASPRVAQEPAEDPPVKSEPVKKDPATRKSEATSETNETSEKSPLKRIPGYPPVENRVSDYRGQANSGKITPEESRPYVIEGVSVTGIFATEYGYGAFLKTEDGSTVIVRKGMRMYNGMVAAVEKDRVLFRQGNGKKLIEKRYGQNINAKHGEEDAQ